MTYGEILTAIEASQRARKDELAVQALVAYRQAELISILVNRSLGAKSTVPTIYELFPGVFPEPEAPKQQSWELMKARIEAYAAEKRKRGEIKHGDHAGGASDPDHIRDIWPERRT